MNKRKIIVLILGISFIISCKQKENSQISEIETWKLSWRMIENSMEDNYEIANLQFDSLRNITNNIDRKYLLTGLKSKNEIGKDEEIIQILSAQDENMLREICTSEFLSKFEICSTIPKEKVENESLQNELIKMYVDDQAVRNNLMQNIIDKYNIDTTEITKDGGVEVDERNRNRLKKIIGEFGFPTKSISWKRCYSRSVFYYSA